MTELGESASLTPVKETPDKYLHAKLIEVTFEGGYKTCRKKTTVQVPHCPARADGPNQSQKPAVFPFDHKGTQKAKVKIKIDSKGYSGNGKLRGILKTLEFEGDIPLSSGEHTVETTLKEPPEGVAWVRGEMSWGVESVDLSVLAGAALVELFFVFDDPAKKPFFRKTGVWVEALRFLLRKSHVSGKQKEPDAVREVTKCCFSIEWHRYDIDEGAANYGGFSSTFDLKRYMKAAVIDPVNCYDQAYAVIVFGGALGLLVDGLFLEPFGFLKLTHLVGWGPCNNPFPNWKFQGEIRRLVRANIDTTRKAEALAALKMEDFLVVDSKDPDRVDFANHMFCEHAKRIYDSCAGPVLGSGDRESYVDKTIDKVMPPAFDSSSMGTAGNIRRLGPILTEVD